MVKRLGALLLLLLAAACNLDRNLDRARFACESGGTCTDAGPTPRDATPNPDARPDTGDAGESLLPDIEIPDIEIPDIDIPECYPFC